MIMKEIEKLTHYTFTDWTMSNMHPNMVVNNLFHKVNELIDIINKLQKENNLYNPNINIK